MGMFACNTVILYRCRLQLIVLQGSYSIHSAGFRLLENQLVSVIILLFKMDCFEGFLNQCKIDGMVNYNLSQKSSLKDH